MTTVAGVHQASFDLDAEWELNPSVSIRPEPFGALMYHFGTRRLSFLKSRQLLDVVQALADCGTARAACARAGVEPSQLPTVGAALRTLLATDMLRPKAGAPAGAHPRSDGNGDS